LKFLKILDSKNTQKNLQIPESMVTCAPTEKFTMNLTRVFVTNNL
jgi:hypothetical protein